MARTRFLVLNRRIAMFILILGALFLLADFSYQRYILAERLPPEMMLAKAIENTKACTSYRYQTESQLVVNNHTSSLSRVQGEKVAPDRVHITGTMVNTPIDFIQVKDTAYLKDQFSGKWLTLEGNQLSQSELFITELNPLANFTFKSVPSVKYEGQEKLDGAKYRVLSFSPVLNNPFLDMQFKDFKYTLWVNPFDYTIHQATIQGTSKSGDRAELIITLKFWDYNKKITINPPVK